MGRLYMAKKKPLLQLGGVLKLYEKSYIQLNDIFFSLENPCFYKNKAAYKLYSEAFPVSQRKRTIILPSSLTSAGSFQSEPRFCSTTRSGQGICESTALSRLFGRHSLRIHDTLPTALVAGAVINFNWLIMPVTRSFSNEANFETSNFEKSKDSEDCKVTDSGALGNDSFQTSDSGGFQQICAFLKEGKWGQDIALNIAKLDLHLRSEDISCLLLQSVEIDVTLGFFRWARLQKRYEVDCSVYMTLFKALSDGKRAGDLWWLINEMQKNGLPVSNSMLVTVIELYSSMRRIDEALKVFENFKKFECTPTTANYNFILKLLSSVGNNLKINMLYNEMKRIGCSPDTTTYAIMIGMLGRAGKYDEAQRLLQDMGSRGCTADVRAYATLIKSFGQAGKVDSALQHFNEMKERNIAANEEVYCYLIDSLAEVGKLDESNGLFQEMEKLGVKPSASTCICLITAFIKSGKQVEACSLFDQMTAKNHISKSAIEPVILKLRKIHKIDFAWDFLHALFSRDYRPDAAMHYFLVHAFCMANRADLALKVFHQAVIDNEENALVETFNVLIESLGKVDVEGARQLFQLMKNRGRVPDVATYNCVIEILLKGSLPDAAYDMFQQMVQQNCQGNLVTYKLLVKLLTHPKHVGHSPTALNSFWKEAKVEEAHEFLSELSRKGLLTFGEVDRKGSVLEASS
ncbi:hypothetical protein O6H91_15G003100 [Diphasiastrum complanatum]|uniref:Uncharacterized protein n=4 Tax=Diphasiastrum complanatum TaxID=34168 RepID=A0ACC2BF71_DIPCM|nr:hypothetical protein O6H91_15G003100 [Diphasiastrum complanatum]